MCDFSFLLTPCPHWVTSSTTPVFHFLGASSSLSLPFPRQEPSLQACVPCSPHGRGNVSAQPCGTGEIPFLQVSVPTEEPEPLCRSQACRPTFRGTWQYLAIPSPAATLKTFPKESMSLCTPHYVAKRSICSHR